tara:strand:+ start:461 stop:577 length:117 start_codon:yes stop_codon:yes gene_type:complete
MAAGFICVTIVVMIFFHATIVVVAIDLMMAVFQNPGAI